jgi:adenylate cyclase
MQFQRILRFGLSALILLALLVDTLDWHQYPYLTKLENWTYDVRLNSTRPNSLDDRIVILDIDENSLAEVGQWPWGRDKLAVIVDNLFEYYQVDTVGFDISFAEKDQSSGLETFEKLARGELSQDPAYQTAFAKIRPSLQHDRIFAESLLGRNVVMGYIFKTPELSKQSENTGSLPPPTMKMDAEWKQRLRITKSPGYVGNLEMLQTATELGGYIDNPLVDADGVFRRVPLIQNYGENLYSSLALAVAQAHLDQLVGGVEPDFSGNELIAYTIAMQMLHQHAVMAETYTTGVTAFGEPAMIELVTTIGYYCLISLTLNVFEIPLEQGMTDPFPED